MKKILFHAAEAKLYQTKEGILKDRIEKTYRHPQLDLKIRRMRTRAEARLLTKALQAGIPVPQLLQQTETTLLLEEIKGKKLADTLDTASNKQALIKELGKIIAKLHNANLIHGDLTTSNILITIVSKARKPSKLNPSPKRISDTRLTLIDFGLGYESNKIEDKATDLHVFKEALEAKHYRHAETLWTTFLASYTKATTNKQIITQLAKVELRGRYKQQF
ncbi:Kae1-associated serine/threonine protein kinase [Candidatus Pacearchaeota archaeon]|nr:Kae1-associated serine/threonine protein kinase [Candidatus Pacearchaeota archaeon]